MSLITPRTNDSRTAKVRMRNILLILGSLKPLMGLLHPARGVAAGLITDYGQVY
jgi:hypothetical protein